MLDVTAPVTATNGKSAAEPDPRETRRVDRGARRRDLGRRARSVPARSSKRSTVRARTRGADIPITLTTPYINTIPVHAQPQYPGRPRLRRKAAPLRALERDGDGRAREQTLTTASAVTSPRSIVGNADATSASTTSGIAPSANHGGDLVYFQGHSSPGVYSRAFVDGRSPKSNSIRSGAKSTATGLSSYPHPWLLPDFWQFATVSMGLGPLQAVYQARFMKYLHDRGIDDTTGRKVWCFIGDGEVDEPETLAGLGIASRENLDNLIFVVNCNLQRLDGPVRGNGKIIQELEGHLPRRRLERAQGDLGPPLGSAAAPPTTPATLVRLMGETVDGDYQTYKSRDGAFVRENFFGKYPETRALVDGLVRRRRLEAQPRRPRSV